MFSHALCFCSPCVCVYVCVRACVYFLRHCFTSRFQWKSFQVLSADWQPVCACVSVRTQECFFPFSSVGQSRLFLWLCFPSHFLPAAGGLFFSSPTCLQIAPPPTTHTHKPICRSVLAVSLSLFNLLLSRISNNSRQALFLWAENVSSEIFGLHLVTNHCLY